MGEQSRVERHGSRARRTAVAVILAAALAASGTGTGAMGASATADPACADANHPGGEWRSYGRDLANSRSQPAEQTIGPEMAGALAPEWIFDTAAHLAGIFDATPVVADGCIYIGSSSARVFALNADTGKVVWETQLEGGPSDRGGNVVASVSVQDGQVVGIVNLLSKPYAYALDQQTGALQWRTEIDAQENAFNNSSAVVYDGLLFAGFSTQAERVPPTRGGYAVIDVSDGTILVKRHVIPDDAYAEGFAGASIWSTAAVDTATGYAYVGTSNPHSNRVEHERTNAILKVDLDQGRDTFGEIVAVYKGQSDSYVDGLDDQPACEMFGDDITYGAGFSVTCLQLDVDFGASPNLFVDQHGRTLVGALQKSGVYHAAAADTMARVWTQVVGAPCAACNAASAAVHGGAVHVAAVPPGQVVSLDRTRGSYRWAAPLGDGVHYQPVSAANGVVYTVTSTGLLTGFDADTGLPVLVRNLADDTGQAMVNARSSAGVAIARNTVYVAATGFLVAYRLA